VGGSARICGGGMNVVLLSMFSSSADYLDRYFDQVAALRNELQRDGHHLRLILCEGDSTDDTWHQLWDQVSRRHLKAHVFQHHHGNRVFGSLEIPARFAQLSRIWNEMLDCVVETDDRAVIVESDLIWDVATMQALLRRSSTLGGIVAPMVFEVGTERFHDVWAYRRGGERFSNEPPYHHSLATLHSGLIQLDSAGSCLAMPGEVARTCRTTREDELVGFCNEARATGYSVWLDPGLRIQHPPTGQAGCGVGTAVPVEAVRV